MKQSPKGPDFILIGTSRSGTTYLHHLLASLSYFWLPPVKEVHYFDFQRKAGRFNVRWREHMRMLLVGMVKRGATSGFGFTWKYLTGAINDSWYLSLFPPTSGKLKIRGEITPGYSTLSPEEIKQVHELLPDVRLILLVRQPMDRAWSVLKKTLIKKQGRKQESLTNEEMKAIINKSGFNDRADYLAIYEKWSKEFGEEKIFVAYYEDLIATPEKLVQDLNQFFNVQHPLDGEKIFRGRVNSTSQFDLEMPREVRELFHELFFARIEQFASCVGGRSKSYVEQFKKK